MFTQAELEEVVRKRLQKERRAQRNKEAKKDTEAKQVTPTEGSSGVTIEHLAKMFSEFSEKVDSKFDQNEFAAAARKYDLTPGVSDLVRAAWIQKGKPDLNEFIPSTVEALGVPGAAKRTERALENHGKAQAEAGETPRGAIVDGGAPSSIRDSSSITNPRDLTKDDIKRLGVKKVREIVNAYYEGKSNTLQRAFSKGT